LTALSSTTAGISPQLSQEIGPSRNARPAPSYSRSNETGVVLVLPGGKANSAFAGLAEARGQRKGRSWHLAAATYRRLGEKGAYVHQCGFEPMQQEQMVLQDVRTHGRITRREAAELCRLSPDQAKRLLTHLVGQGTLLAHGERKGRYYDVLPNNMGAPISEPIRPTRPPRRGQRGNRP
jgi:hypothetical protein